MASSKDDNSTYVRSAYTRRPSSERPSYRQSRNRGRIWSIIIVLLLIIILVGGAVWLYFINRKVGGEEAVIAQKVAAPQSAESPAGAKSPQPSTENEVASAAPASTAPANTAPANTASTKEEDEFAAILRELGGTEEPSKAEGASNTGKKESEAAAVTTTPEQAPVSSDKLTKELAILEEQTRKAERTAEQLNKATGQLLEQEKETTTLMSKAETKTKEAIGSLSAGAVAKEGAEQEARAPVATITPPPAEKAPVNKPEATTEAFPKTITVQSGDSLSAIAKRVYGDMNKWRLIYKANQDHLKNPNELVAGMKLTIPAPQE